MDSTILFIIIVGIVIIIFIGFLINEKISKKYIIQNNEYERNVHIPVPVPGGCAGTRYGCCPNSSIASNSNGSNCQIGGCAGTRYGCCPNSSIASNSNGSNCPIGGCAGTRYGCCPNSSIASNANGSNC